MHRGIVVLMLCLLCHQQFLRIGLFAYYELNKAYIAKNLCENKSRPELNCSGKCYLKKQLKKVDEANQRGKDISQILSKFKLPPYLAPDLPAVTFADIGDLKSWHERSCSFIDQWKLAIEHPPG